MIPYFDDQSGPDNFSYYDNESDCIDGPDDCSGPIEYRTTPDRGDFKAFLRCTAHYNRRLEQAEENMRKYPISPPDDFDPSYAGESWDEDY